jgi:hypothetical protein
MVDVEASDIEAADVEAADVEAADVEAADVEAADVEAADVEAAAPDSDDRWLDDDAADGGPENATVLGSLTWVLVAGGIMLMLPRQWASAGMSFVLALIVAAFEWRRKRRLASA